MTYQTPPPRGEPFTVGEIVDVRDRELVRISEVRVVQIGTRIVTTDCGREWSAKTGYWIGRHSGIPRAWPFPSIAHKAIVTDDAK